MLNHDASRPRLATTMRSAVARSSAVLEAIREAQLAVTGTHDEDHEKVLAL